MNAPVAPLLALLPPPPTPPPPTALPGMCGTSALWVACKQGHAAAARCLLAHGAVVDAAVARDLSTPLWIAAACGHAPVVRQLLRAGADPRAATAAGVAALDAALVGGFSDVVAALLAHCRKPGSGSGDGSSGSSRGGGGGGALPLDAAAGNPHALAAFVKAGWLVG
jgi:hypothetical protein